MAYGALASTNLNFFVAGSLDILGLAVANTFRPKSTRSRWVTYLYTCTCTVDLYLVVSGLILHESLSSLSSQGLAV